MLQHEGGRHIDFQVMSIWAMGHMKMQIQKNQVPGGEISKYGLCKGAKCKYGKMK